MNEDQLRVLIREIVARHFAGAGHLSAPAPAPLLDIRTLRTHPSHGLLPLRRGEDDGGPCLIEPAVRCNHCSYCQSYGH